MSGALRILVLAALLLAPAAGLAAEDAGTIEPDRPDVSNSTRTVPRGAVQLETGVEYSRTRAAEQQDRRLLAVSAGLRVGITDRLEVGVDGEPIIRLRGEEDATDHGDVFLNAKYRFLDAQGGWPSLGVQPFLKLPLAEAPLGSEKPDLGVIGLASFDLPWQLDLDVNAALALIGQSRPGGYLVQGRTSASLSRELVDRLSAFAEVFFASRDEWRSRHAVGFDTGLVWKLSRWLALDVAAETSLAGPGPDWAVRGGLSVRFGR